MRGLILWADEYSSNLGVRVLAAGNAAMLEKAAPGIEIEYQSFSRPRRELPLGRLRSIVRERVTSERGMQDWFKSFDVIVDTRAGDSFADIYGLRRHRIMSAAFEFAAQSGTPVVLGPQTIGPFDTVQGKWLGRRTLQRARLVMSRDFESADYAARLGRPVDVLTTDVVFALPVPDVARDRDVILNVSGLLWNENPHVDAAVYRKLVTDLHRMLRASGRRVSLLAHVIGNQGHDADVQVMAEFANSVDPDIEQIVPASLEDARRVIASGNVLLGSRMHACLNALSVGTPTIPLAYSRKFKPLFDGIGWHSTVDVREPDAARIAARLAAGSDALASSVKQAGERARSSLSSAVEALRTVTTAGMKEPQSA